MGVVVALSAVAAVTVWYTKKQATQAIDVVGDAINPVSQTNIVNRGVNAVGAVLSSNDNFTLGGWLYDVFNGTQDEQSQRAEEKAMIEKLGG